MLAHCFGSLVLNKGVNNMNNPQIIFLSITISIGVFLLLREVFCWYFKINKRLIVLLDIKAELIQANNYTLKLHKYSLKNVPYNGSGGLGSNVPSDVIGGNGGAITGKATGESFWRAK
jgi:hypothetical protein